VKSLKKIFFTLILIILLNSACFSQPSEFLSGLFFNPNGIHITGHDELFWEKEDGKIWGGGGLSCGIFIKRFIQKKTYIGFEIRFIQKGSIYEISNPYGALVFEMLRLNYTEIPVLIGKTLKFNKKQYLLESGIGFARLFSSEVNVNKYIKRSNNPTAVGFKNIDFSWITSLKFAINKKENLLFGVRTSYSILSIHEHYKLHNLDYGIQLDYVFNQ